jgi:hypothetical protein
MLPQLATEAPEHAVTLLRDAAREASNITGASFGPQDRFNAYLKWVTDSERTLGSVLPPAELFRMLLTRRYWTLNGASYVDFGESLQGQIEVELAARSAAIKDAAAAIEAEIDAWSYQPLEGTFASGRLHAIVLDTNALEMHGTELDTFPWSIRGGLSEGGVGLAVPAVVVDELDRHKTSAHLPIIQNKKVKQRNQASLALRMLDQLFPPGHRRVVIHEDPIAPLFAFLQVNDLDHTPLSAPDAEIIAYALGLRPYAASVTLASYDNNICFTAEHLGIKTIRLRYSDLTAIPGME